MEGRKMNVQKDLSAKHLSAINCWKYVNCAGIETVVIADSKLSTNQRLFSRPGVVRFLRLTGQEG